MMERIKKEEEMRKKKEQEDSLTLEQTKEQVNWIFMVYIHVFEKCSSFSLWILYIHLFCMSRTKYTIMGKMCNLFFFLFAAIIFLRFKEFLFFYQTILDNFCLLNILRYIKVITKKAINLILTKITAWTYGINFDSCGLLLT